MRKLLLMIFLFCNAYCTAATPVISEVRLMYKQAVKNKAVCEHLIKLLEPYNVKNNPLLYGYKACATMVMARHSANPFSKFSHFKKGSKMLANAIEADPNNPELRYLRFTAQMNAPAFLDYKTHLAVDKAFLQKSVSTIQDAQLKQMIISYLKKVV